MSDDEWDNDDDLNVPQVVIPAVVVAGGAGNWDDEDAEDNANVQDDWDASEDEASADSKSPASTAAAKAGTAAAAAPPKKKKGLKEAIAARKAEEEKKKLAALEASQRKEVEEVSETAEERRKREELSIREADLQNARDLFAGIADAPTVQASFLDTMKPKTKDEFEKYEKQLVEKISKHEKATNYALFVENLSRDLCVGLSVEEIKKVASALTILANEKQKATKPVAGAAKKKGKGAVAVVSTKTGHDMTNYDEIDDGDFDDFM